jgi:hypothetical protein
MNCRVAQHHCEPLLIVRTYLPAGYPERWLRHDVVGLWNGLHFGVDELVLQHSDLERVA